MEIFHKRTWAEIDLDAAERNLNILKGFIDKEKTRPCCVLKAFGYGHGDTVLMKLYQSLGVDFFAVSNIDEAIGLRKNGCTGDILILGYTDDAYAAELAEYDIIQAAVSAEYARELSAAAEKPVRVHIKLDTGMGRIGLIAKDREKCLEEIAQIKKLPKLVPEGIFTHFAVADSLEEESCSYTDMQKELFFSIAEEAGGFKEVHCLNSAGAELHYDSRSTLARFGILLYGLNPDTSLEMPKGIEPVMEVKTVIGYIKELHKGDCVSYGRTFTAQRDMRAATLPIGYADGYPRLLSNRGEVIICGKRAKILGRVCMDQMIVDITDIPEAKIGTEVTVFGRGEITADDIAALCGSIGYEIICAVSPRVPRVYLKNGKIVDVVNIL
ncbi:MAG: alanine racemase [Oscillospiraceae bacterium]